MTTTSQREPIGCSFILIAITFTVLKLTHVIDWRWVWVLSPIWITLCMVLGIHLMLFIIRSIMR